MDPDTPMTILEKESAVEPARPPAQTPTIRFPMSATICLVSFVGMIAARHAIPAAAFGLGALGFITAWIYGSYAEFRRAGATPPRWLAVLERLREYLASEPEPLFRQAEGQ
jgi:hypothetical protein